MTIDEIMRTAADPRRKLRPVQEHSRVDASLGLVLSFAAVGSLPAPRPIHPDQRRRARHTTGTAT
jgi:hypothetical protein